MPRKVKLTLPQRVALEFYAEVRAHAYVSPLTVDLLQRKGLIVRPDTQHRWTVTDKGRSAIDSGYLPT